MEKSDNHLLIICLLLVENIIYRMLWFVKKSCRKNHVLYVYLIYVKMSSIVGTGRSMNASLKASQMSKEHLRWIKNESGVFVYVIGWRGYSTKQLGNGKHLTLPLNMLNILILSFVFTVFNTYRIDNLILQYIKPE